MSEDFMPQLPYFEGEKKGMRVSLGYEAPPFSVKETARFFDRSVMWVRWRVGDKTIMTKSDGTPIEIERSPSGARSFTLENIRDLTQSLYREGRITKGHYNVVAQRVSSFATREESKGK